MTTVEHCIAIAGSNLQAGGSTSSDSDKQSPEAFINISFDVKDHILSLIDSPRDLLSLSLTSREWGAIILPLHIRYRELRIRPNQPEVWQHLATRTDLSKNIRKICLMTPNDRHDQKLPLILKESHHIVKDLGIPTDSEEIHSRPEMIEALSRFESLVSFTWLESDQHAEEVFDALTNCHGLVELILGVPSKDHISPESSIWRIRNLRILVLKGLNWLSLGDAECSFISMLNNSPALEELTIPCNFATAKFSTCRFRSLIKFHLPYFKTGAFIPGGPLITIEMINFLLAHPTIQNLSWYPLDRHLASLPEGLLPNLKHLFINHGLTTALLSDTTLLKSRMLETISEIYLDRNTMQLLETINGSRLQEIHIWQCDGVETIRRLAVLFPSIKTLGIHSSKFTLNDEASQDDCINCLGEFPLLETLYDSPLPPVIHAQIADEKEEIIRKLYTRCSALKTIRNWSSMFMLQWGGDIVSFRDGPDVTWKQIKKDP